MHAKRIPCKDGNSVTILRVASEDSSLGFTEDRIVALGLCSSEAGPGTTFAGP